MVDVNTENKTLKVTKVSQVIRQKDKTTKENITDKKRKVIGTEGELDKITMKFMEAVHENGRKQIKSNKKNRESLG